jgi:hypothetical protein
LNQRIALPTVRVHGRNRLPTVCRQLTASAEAHLSLIDRAEEMLSFMGANGDEHRAELGVVVARIAQAVASLRQAFGHPLYLALRRDAVS